MDTQHILVYLLQELPHPTLHRTQCILVYLYCRYHHDPPCTTPSAYLCTCCRYYHDLFDFAVVDSLMYHYDSKHYIVYDHSEAHGLTVRLDHGRA